MGDKKNAFHWNEDHPEPSGPVPELPSRQGTVVPDNVSMGNDLIELGSCLKRLRQSYLSTNEREEIGKELHRRFLHLERIAKHAKDPAARKRVEEFLVGFSNLRVAQFDKASGESVALFSLGDAIAHGRHVQWVMRFYAGVHDLCGPDKEGAEVCYQVTKEMLEEESRLHKRLLRWLEDEA